MLSPMTECKWVKENKPINPLQSRERLENQYGSSHTMLQMKSMHATITDMDFVWACVDVEGVGGGELMFYSYTETCKVGTKRDDS